MPQSFATQIAKDRFYDQMERYRNLNDSLDLPSGVIPLYLLVLTFFVDRLVAFWPTTWSWNRMDIAYAIFLLAVVLLAVSVLWAGWGYCQTILFHQIAIDLPSPKEMDNWFRTLSKDFAKDEDLETACDQELRDRYVTAAEETFQNNERRALKLFHCRRRLVAALILTAIATVCYYTVDNFQHHVESNAPQSNYKSS